MHRVTLDQVPPTDSGRLLVRTAFLLKVLRDAGALSDGVQYLIAAGALDSSGTFTYIFVADGSGLGEAERGVARDMVGTFFSQVRIFSAPEKIHFGIDE
jgi:hypothetical protein